MEVQTKDFIRLEIGMIWLIIVILLLTLCSCTKTEYIVVERNSTDTLFVTKHQRDSIWVHDSIMISEKGDTIRIEKWHTKYIEKQVRDTTYVATHDTFPQPYPVTEYVEKKLSTFQVVLMTIGALALMGIVVFLVSKLKRFLPCR